MKLLLRLAQTLLCLSVLLAPLQSHAQGDRVIIEREGQRYFVHTVGQGHTLYSIGKLYQCSVDDLLAANPGSDEKLQIGQSLYIPVPDDFDSKRWTNPIRLEGAFMIHKVMRKETIYGICRQYTLDINRFLELNPDAEQGIQPGMELRIPVNDLYQPQSIDADVPPDHMDPTVIGSKDDEQEIGEKEEATEEIARKESPWQTHLVQAGETLYGICKSYRIEQAAFLEVNGGLPEGLKAGELVNLPLRKTNESASESFEVLTSSTLASGFLDPSLRDSSFLKERYRVVLMLPFLLEKATDDPEVEKSQAEERLQEIAMQFYYGTKAALDSLKDQGARLEVTYLDVHGGSNVDELLQHPAVRQCDLIIGPLQRSVLEKVASYASKKGIHIVCPVPQSNKILLSNPNLSKAQPSADSQMRAISSHVFRSHRGENVLLINSKEIKDQRMVEAFKRDYLARLRTLGDSTLRGFVEVSSSSQFVGELESKLSKARRNILVVPAGSQSKSMVANLQTKIQLLSKDYDILIYAPEDWLEYDFLDLSFKERVQLTVPVANFIDYNDPRTAAFVEAHRTAFGSEASNFTLLGFDIMQYYGRGLLYYGINFPNTFHAIPDGDLLSIRFQYKRTGLDSGYENEHTFIVTQNNYCQKALGHD